MISNESTVRAAIAEAIRSIARSELGFDLPDGNIHEYLVEDETPEGLSDYLKAVCEGENVVRSWAVEVLAADEIARTQRTYQRSYLVSVCGYYGYGIRGSGKLLLIEHFRKVRGAIKDLGTTLGGLVTQLESVDGPNFTTELALDSEDFAIHVGRVSYRYLTIEADF